MRKLLNVKGEKSCGSATGALAPFAREDDDVTLGHLSSRAAGSN